MEKNKYTWVPFYKELAVALLQFRDNRKELVNWIYTELSLIKGEGGKCLVEYLHEKDGSHISDIDPFSVFAIFNRATSFRGQFVEAFKNKFRPVRLKWLSDHLESNLSRCHPIF